MLSLSWNALCLRAASFSLCFPIAQSETSADDFQLCTFPLPQSAALGSSAQKAEKSDNLVTDFTRSPVHEMGLSDLDFLVFGQGRADPAPSLTPWCIIQGFCCLCVTLIFQVSHLACGNSLAVRYSQYKQPMGISYCMELHLPGSWGENPLLKCWVCAGASGCGRYGLSTSRDVHPRAQWKKVCAHRRNNIFDKFVIF